MSTQKKKTARRKSKNKTENQTVKKTSDGIPVWCAFKEIRQADSLIPFPRNPNKHPENQIQLLAKIIKNQGWRNPIVVSARSGFITKGHARLKAALLNKWKQVPVDVQQYANEALEWSDIIADNKIAELSEMDAPTLKDILQELDTGALDMDLTAFDKTALEELMTQFNVDDTQDAEPQIDRAEELNKVWKVKTGDLWQIGEHRLLCGDSSQKEIADSIMSKDLATLLFTDPPYGVSIGKKNVMLNTFQKAGRCLTNLDMDDMPPKELGEMLLKVFTLWRDYMADDCSCFVCSPQGGGLGMMMMMMMMKDAGLEVRHILNWIKNSPTFSMGRLDYDYQHEPILFTWKKTHKRKKEGQFQTSLWNVDKPMANKEHPTMKPVELPMNAIMNHTDKNDIVVDMFLGSGTTMVACQNLNRKCRGIEISPNYVAVCLDRMSRAFPEIKIERL